MGNIMLRSAILSALVLGACLAPEEGEHIDETSPEIVDSEVESDDSQAHGRESFASDNDQVIDEDEDATVEPSFAAPCGKVGPLLDGRVITDAVSPNSAAQQRSGSSTGCTAIGALQRTDDARYFCYTHGTGGTWTYLENTRTRVRGWVRDDLLRFVGGVRGSNKYCGF